MNWSVGDVKTGRPWKALSSSLPGKEDGSSPGATNYFHQVWMFS